MMQNYIKMHVSQQRYICTKSWQFNYTQHKLTGLHTEHITYTTHYNNTVSTEQTAIISLFSFKLLLYITDTVCVYYAVRNEYLNILYISFVENPEQIFLELLQNLQKKL